MLRKVIIVGAMASALAGCVTAKNTLSLEDVATLKYASTEVRFAPDAVIYWGDGERAYAASKGQPATESDNLAKTPEGQAYLRNTIATKVKTAMERNLGKSLKGTRPVRAVVTVKRVMIASAIQRIIIGGNHEMGGDVTLTDARTGAALLSYDGQTTPSAAGQGIGGALIDAALLPDPIDRVTDNYAIRYTTWLTRYEPADMLAQAR
jgi:hypothetical protein